MMFARLFASLSLLLSCTGVSVFADGHFDYFQLRAASGGCLGRPGPGHGDALLLKSCSFDDDSVMWRWDEMGRFHSKSNDMECIQAENAPDILLGPGVLKRGTQMYVKGCKDGNLGSAFQSFDKGWEFDLDGPLRLDRRPGLCMTYRGANPVIGRSPIILFECASLGGERGMGWMAASPSYFALESFDQGCIGRQNNGQDELILKRCTANDANIQWRIDDMGRLRSKAADSECIQAEQRPELLLGTQALDAGTTMYAKTCGGPIKDPFQMFNTLFPMPLVYPPQISGPLSLMSRQDLCVVHFGAQAIIGVRIFMLECDSLGGTRALGWAAADPCSFPPFCPVTFNVADP